MANFNAANAIGITEAANFIPELWSNEVIAAYKENLVLGQLVTRMNHKGKKGDTVHIPSPTRGNASAKAHATQVTLINNVEGVVNVTIDRHFEYSRLIEDLADVQGLSSLRRFYVDDAGHALAKIIDWHLHVQGTSLQGATEDTSSVDTPGGNLTYTNSTGAVIGSDGSTTWADTTDGNGAALADAGIRKMIQTLDDADVPMTERYMVVPPVEKKNLLGISRFTEQAFIGDTGGANSIRNGLVGDVYGMPVYVSTNCGHTIDAGGTTAFRAGMIFHKSAFVLIEQMSPRTQTQYKQEFLADLLTVDCIYGVDELRNDAGIVFIVPA